MLSLFFIKKYFGTICFWLNRLLKSYCLIYYSSISTVFLQRCKKAECMRSFSVPNWQIYWIATQEQKRKRKHTPNWKTILRIHVLQGKAVTSVSCCLGEVLFSPGSNVIICSVHPYYVSTAVAQCCKISILTFP